VGSETLTGWRQGVIPAGYMSTESQWQVSGQNSGESAGQHLGRGTSPSSRSSRPRSVDDPALIGIPKKLGLLVRPSAQGEAIRLVATARRKEIGYDPLGLIAEM
jgi:hypothetical protein